MVCGENVDRLDNTPVPLPRMARGIVSGAHWLLAGERFNVRHGRCDRHRVPWSKYIGVVAGIATIATMLLFVGSMLAGNGRFGILQAMLVGAFAVSIVLTVALSLTNLRIERTDGQYVWIGGFGRAFRATLPPLGEGH